MRIVEASEIETHLDIASLVDPIREAFVSISQGTSHSPVVILTPTEMSDMHVKSATLVDCPIFTVKLAGWSQTLADRGISPTTGFIAVFDSRTAEPLAMLKDNHLISDYRTAAAGALVTRICAPEYAKTLCVVGTGRQAELQARAVCLERSITRIVIWGRSSHKAVSLAAQLRETIADCDIAVEDGLQKAVEQADIVVAATTARTPIIEAHWLRPGQHVTSVGSDDASKCELAVECFDRADAVIVDSRKETKKHGNIHRWALSGATCSDEQLWEIGELAKGRHKAWRQPNSLSIATLVGLGVQDLCVVSNLERLWK